MSLLTTTEATSAAIAADAQRLAGFASACVNLANSMAKHPLSLSAADLTEWLNAKPSKQRNAEFDAHAALGEALNAAVAVAEASMGLPAESLGRVDVRPVADKLAAQNRAMAFGADGFSVTDLPRVEVPATEESPEPI
jgi:hypothetical protein